MAEIKVNLLDIVSNFYFVTLLDKYLLFNEVSILKLQRVGAYHIGSITLR